jgi:prepilin-type N-terminal cleavage/methylation domain-containing protein/prepilin-type processing-associated H-X9-DG protein
MSRQVAARRAFTLVELLVVIAIIGVLVALLLPAVQSAREAARRMQCSNNLKQLALACHGYQTAFTALPMSIGPWVDQCANGAREPNGKGWIISALPFLEQQNLYDQFAVGFKGSFFSNGGIKNPACAEAMRTRLSFLNCPSEPSGRQLSDHENQWEGTKVAVTNYKGVIGDTRMGETPYHSGTSPDCHSREGCNGTFYRCMYVDNISLASIRDGTSNTFFIGEDVPSQNWHSAAFYSNGDYASCHAPLNYFVPPPGDANNWGRVISFRSLHPGGAHFAYGDGSVRFTTDTINYSLYRALSTKAGGEIVSLP